jgi:aminopeptidase
MCNTNNLYYKFSNYLLKHSINIKKNERILLEVNTKVSEKMIGTLVDLIYKNKAIPFISISNNLIQKKIFLSGNKEEFVLKNKIEMNKIKNIDAIISISSSENPYDFLKIPIKKMNLINKSFRDLSEYRVNKTKWVILKWPNNSMAQKAKMDTESFKKYYFKACMFNYKEIYKSIKYLKNLVNKTNDVQIITNNTKLSFSIENINSILCIGNNNIPDGEIFTAPNKNSVNGEVFLNVPSFFQGQYFEDIYLKFKNGKIIKAKCKNNNNNFLKIINSDCGSKYIGEFAIGINPIIKKPIIDTLFDEKISGSFHIALGNSYQETNNGNKSLIHWDLISIMDKKYNNNKGGCIIFDGKKICENGKFLLKELNSLN